MNRYIPTDDERAALVALGWYVDDEDWWWPPGSGGCGYGKTYREAIREQVRLDRRDRAVRRRTERIDQ